MKYLLMPIALFFGWCAKPTMTQIGRYMHKAPGLPSKFDKVTPR